MRGTPPRTTVAFEIRPVRPAGVARFRLPDWTTIAALTAEHPEADLDAAWAGYGLRGAALVFPWNARHVVVYDTALSATDHRLILNVLARARTAVLLGRAPAVLDPVYLDRDLACDDPRIVGLAAATGADALPRP